MFKRVSLFGKLIPVWLVVAILISSGGGAAAGTVLTGKVSGDVNIAASQALVIDASNFTLDDLSSHVARRFVSVSDDATAFTAAAELATGEELIIDLPLANLSRQDAAALFTLDVPSPLQANIQEFWKTQLRTTVPTYMISDPTPAPHHYYIAPGQGGWARP